MKKIVYLDILRVGSMMAVVLLHLMTGFYSSPISWESDLLLFVYAIANCAVPIFFMISGALILSSDKTMDIKTSLSKRLCKICVPFLVWSIIIVLIASFQQFLTNGYWDIVATIKTILTIPSRDIAPHLWFVYFIVPLYLLSPLLKAAMNTMQQTHIRYFLCLWGLVVVLHTFRAFLPVSWQGYAAVTMLDRTFLLEGYVGYFVLGYYFHHYKMNIRTRYLVGIAVFSYVCIAFFTMISGRLTGQYNMNFLAVLYIFIVALSSSLFLLAKRHLKRIPCSKVFPIFTSLSFMLYLSHNLVNSYLYLIGIKVNTLMHFMIGFLVIVGVCLLLGVIITSCRFTCYIMTGIPYEVAKKSCNITYLKNTFYKKKIKDIQG